MHPRTELLLYQLAWNLDKLLRPTWRNLDSSLESWAYGNGVLRQVQRLEAQAFIETRRDEKTGQRVMRLTAKGLAAGRVGDDPEQRWHRAWDGKWRMILFDLPEEQRATRHLLRQKLRVSGFGCLQRSAWISPDPLESLALELRALAVNAANLVLLDATPCGGESSADMVRGAWDFKRIEEAWQDLEAHLAAIPDGSKPLNEESLGRWIAKERNLLQRCFRLDPLLPKELLPATYQGITIWKKRRQILSLLAQTLA
jgi:phenylacetic acid degradation operon negative regulatory protein